MSKQSPMDNTENNVKSETIEDIIDACCYSKPKPPEDTLCAACNRPIKGMIVQALGKTWHQEHFCCSHCKKPISGQRFNVEENKPYCEHDYSQLFLKRCQGCNLPILDVVVVALNCNWHYDHFVCATCGTRLAQQGYYERENNPFCKTCYEERFCPKCKECLKPIKETAIMALGEKWHQDCFKCSRCFVPITEATFEVYNGKQLCDKCITQISKAEMIASGEGISTNKTLPLDSSLIPEMSSAIEKKA
ncbi:unnamed protein product [Nezara viridula]|uniref:LIM zinc-binding domain-containing protein n=1 Tax=Nezara viridula TaxID=85310 RepID=A0A9P0MKS4_NEZVI|nr:unnamed protein product [Nezara viridula]